MVLYLCPSSFGEKVGSTLQFGLKSKIEKGNVISVQNIPDGTIVCNIEKHFGDGGAIVKSAGTDATVFSHMVMKVLQLNYLLVNLLH